MTTMFKDHTGAEHDFDALPQASRNALVGRAISHVLGNEVASIVVGKVRAVIAAAGNVKSDTVKTEEIKAWREAHSAEIQAFTTAAQAFKMSQIAAGELGVRSASTAVDPLSRAMFSIARDEIRSLFKKQGWTFPTGENVFKMGDNEFTKDELVQRWLDGIDRGGDFGKAQEANAPRIERIAHRALAAKATEAKRLAGSETDAKTLAESLGF